jgi:amino acid transporter
MQWFTRASSHASVVNAVALALGFYWPVIETGVGRAVLIITLTLTLAVINVRGIRQGAWVVNALTIGKLLPLALFIIVGLFFAEWDRLTSLPPVTMEQASAAGLLLIFTFGGYDVISVPAGEAANPRRHLPFAFVMTIVGVTLVMTLAQIVTMTTLEDVAGSSTPVADAALGFMGSWGAAMIGIGSVVSMTGHNAGSLLTGSRMIFALAENRHLPSLLGRVHARTRTPANAIWFTTSVVLVLALSGSFVALAAASAVARLVTYTGTCGATLALRRPCFAGRVPPARFVVPGGPIVPILAIVVSLVILVGASLAQLIGGAAVLATGALLFAVSAERSPPSSG